MRLPIEAVETPRNLGLDKDACPRLQRKQLVIQIRCRREGGVWREEKRGRGPLVSSPRLSERNLVSIAKGRKLTRIILYGLGKRHDNQLVSCFRFWAILRIVLSAIVFALYKPLTQAYFPKNRPISKQIQIITVSIIAMMALLAWLKEKRRNVLLVRCARQVKETYLVRGSAKQFR
jgi:hypothetical protein